MFQDNMAGKTKSIFYIVTGVLVIYVICANSGLTFGIVMLLFLLSFVGLLWMVYSILTDDSNLSGKTFDDYFYEDEDFKNDTRQER